LKPASGACEWADAAQVVLGDELRSPAGVLSVTLDALC
jgi:hypothetical protein